jgi:hypothetical protein
MSDCIYLKFNIYEEVCVNCCPTVSQQNMKKPCNQTLFCFTTSYMTPLVHLELRMFGAKRNTKGPEEDQQSKRILTLTGVREQGVIVFVCQKCSFLFLHNSPNKHPSFKGSVSRDVRLLVWDCYVLYTEKTTLLTPTHTRKHLVL